MTDHAHRTGTNIDHIDAAIIGGKMLIQVGACMQALLERAGVEMLGAALSPQQAVAADRASEWLAAFMPNVLIATHEIISRTQHTVAVGCADQRAAAPHHRASAHGGRHLN